MSGLPGRAIALSEHPYDRVHERRSDEEWLARAWAAPSTRVLVVGGNRVDAPDGAVRWVSPAEAPEGTRILLGEREGVVSFAVAGPKELAGEDWSTLREVATLLDPADAAHVVHAVGLAEWMSATRFCPRCAADLVPVQSGHVLECTSHGHHQFPRTDAAVIMLIRDEDDRALLGRQTVWPEGRWSTLAGFVEPGESLEMTVRREVFEEVGIRVGAVEYFGSQPWPLPASLMLGFTGVATSYEVTVDGKEIAEAGWFSREDIRAGLDAGTVRLPGSISISHFLIEDWYGESLPGGW